MSQTAPSAVRAETNRDANDDGALVTFRNVTKSFETGSGRSKRTVTAVDDVTLDVERGEIFAVIGYSGAGKSTLVRLINGLEAVTSGSLRVDGKQVDGRSESQLAPIRHNIGMIFQQFNLFTSRTVAGNVEYPLKRAKWSKEKRKERVEELLKFVGLSERAKYYPEQLSGGQKQRVGIARALAAGPTLLLADESTSALDPETTHEVLELLKRVNREFGITIVLITHEMEVVRSVADRVAVMDSGKVVEIGTTAEVFSNPQTHTAQRFVASVMHATPQAEEAERLRRLYEGRLVSVETGDDIDVGGVLSDAAVRGVRFRFVFGGISVLQDRSFGSVTIALTGDDAAVEQTVADLKAITEVSEVSA